MDNFIACGKINGYFYPTELKLRWPSQKLQRTEPDGRKIVMRLQSKLGLFYLSVFERLSFLVLSGLTKKKINQNENKKVFAILQAWFYQFVFTVKLDHLFSIVLFPPTPAAELCVRKKEDLSMVSYHFCDTLGMLWKGLIEFDCNFVTFCLMWCRTALIPRCNMTGSFWKKMSDARNKLHTSKSGEVWSRAVIFSTCYFERR